MIARARTFAIWLAMMAVWFMTSPTCIAIRKLLDI